MGRAGAAGRGGFFFGRSGRTGCTAGGSSGRRRAARTRRAGRRAAARRARTGRFAVDGQGQRVALHGAVVVGDDGVDLIAADGHGRDRNGHGRMACSGLDFFPVGVPAEIVAVGILAAELCFEDIGAAEQALALVGDLDGHCGKHGRDVNVLLELVVGAGAGGDTVAPLDENIALGGNCRHADGLGRIGHGVAQGGLVGLTAGGQRTAALFFDPIVRFIVNRLSGGTAGALAGRLRAGSLDRRTGVGNILQCAGRDVGGIRTAVIGGVGVGAQIAQRCLEARTLQVDVAVCVVVRLAVAILPLEDLGGVQKLEAQLLAQIEQCHVHVVDLGLIHVRVGRVIRRDGWDGVDDDIGIGIAGLDGLDQSGIIRDKVGHFHAVVVGAEGDDHAAGLHHGDSLGNGIGIAVLLKSDDALIQGHLCADALLGAELLQGDQAVVVQAHRVGVADEEGLVLVGLPRIGRFRQQRRR